MNMLFIIFNGFLTIIYSVKMFRALSISKNADIYSLSYFFRTLQGNSWSLVWFLKFACWEQFQLRGWARQKENLILNLKSPSAWIGWDNWCRAKCKIQCRGILCWAWEFGKNRLWLDDYRFVKIGVWFGVWLLI